MRHYNTVTGVLKGYDQLLNLVLDEVEEAVQGEYTVDLFQVRRCQTGRF